MYKQRPDSTYRSHLLKSFGSDKAYIHQQTGICHGCWLLSAKSFLIPMRLFQNVLCQSVDTNTINLNNIYKRIFVYFLTVTSRPRVKQSYPLPDCGSMFVKRGPFYALYAHRMYMYIFASQITRKTRLFVQKFVTTKKASKFRITDPWIPSKG